MKDFFSETLPNLGKTLVVVIIVVAGTMPLHPQIAPKLFVETPLGMLLLVPAAGAAIAGWLISRMVNGLVSLLIVAGLCAAVNFFSPEIQMAIAKSSAKTAKAQATASTPAAQ